MTVVQSAAGVGLPAKKGNDMPSERFETELALLAPALFV